MVRLLGVNETQLSSNSALLFTGCPTLVKFISPFYLCFIFPPNANSSLNSAYFISKILKDSFNHYCPHSGCRGLIFVPLTKLYISLVHLKSILHYYYYANLPKILLFTLRFLQLSICVGEVCEAFKEHVNINMIMMSRISSACQRDDL